MINLLWFASLSFLAAISGAITPGPVFMLVVSESLKNGKIAGPLIVLGHFIIEWIIIFMVFLGLSPILESEYAMIFVGFVGGAALALMGLKLVMDATRLKMDNASTINISLNSAGRPLYMLVALGFLSSCSNPYVFIWWLATGFPMITSFISLAGLPGFLSFLVGHAAADLSWFSFVSYSVCKGRRIMNKVIIQVILFASAIFLIIFAAYLIVLAWIRMS